MPQEENTNPQAGEAEEPQAGSGGEEQGEGEGEVVKLRKENASWRRKMRDAEARIAEHEKAQMGESERLRKEAAEAMAKAQAAEATLRLTRFEAALATVVGEKVGLYLKLIEPEFDDEGKPVNVKAAVAKVQEEYPELKPQAAPAPGATNPGRQPKLTIEDVKKMSADEINRRWDDVREALKAGR